MADKSKTKAWWIDTEGNLGEFKFGDDITGLLTEEGLQQLVNLQQVGIEEPEEKEDIKGIQVENLRVKLKEAEEKIKEMADQIAKTPKGVSEAKSELKKLKAELKDLKSARTKSENAKSEELSGLKNRVTDLEGFLKDREDQVTELKTDLEAATAPKEDK